jgi:hypothetical protein
MANADTVEMVFTEDDVFVVFNGIRIAKRSDYATWISLEPGWQVFDTKERDLTIEYNGARIQ